jgi:hypothetical protein
MPQQSNKVLKELSRKLSVRGEDKNLLSLYTQGSRIK